MKAYDVYIMLVGLFLFLTGLFMLLAGLFGGVSGADLGRPVFCGSHFVGGSAWKVEWAAILFEVAVLFVVSCVLDLFLVLLICRFI